MNEELLELTTNFGNACRSIGFNVDDFIPPTHKSKRFKYITEMSDNELKNEIDFELKKLSKRRQKSSNKLDFCYNEQILRAFKK